MLHFPQLLARQDEDSRITTGSLTVDGTQSVIIICSITLAPNISPDNAVLKCESNSQGLIINVALTKEMVPYYTEKLFSPLTVNQAVLIITPV